MDSQNRRHCYRPSGGPHLACQPLGWTLRKEHQACPATCSEAAPPTRGRDRRRVPDEVMSDQGFRRIINCHRVCVLLLRGVQVGVYLLSFSYVYRYIYMPIQPHPLPNTHQFFFFLIRKRPTFFSPQASGHRANGRTGFRCPAAPSFTAAALLTGVWVVLCALAVSHPSFLPSHKYLLSSFYVPGTLVHSGNTDMKKMPVAFPSGLPVPGETNCSPGAGRAEEGRDKKL